MSAHFLKPEKIFSGIPIIATAENQMDEEGASSRRLPKRGKTMLQSKSRLRFCFNADWLRQWRDNYIAH